MSSNEEKIPKYGNFCFILGRKKKNKKILSPQHVRATTIFRNYEALFTGKEECLATEWRRPPWQRV